MRTRPGLPAWAGLDSLGGAVAASVAAALAVVAIPDRRIALVVAAIPCVVLGMSAPRVLRRLLLAIVVLEIPIQFDIYLGYDSAEAALTTISGYNVSLTTVALVGLYWLWALDRATARRTDAPRVPRLAPHFVYVGVVVASLLWAMDPELAAFEITILLQSLAVLVYLVKTARTVGDIEFLVRMVAVSVIIQAAMAAFLSLGPALVELGPVTLGRNGARVAGALGSANGFGAYLALHLPLMLALSLGGRSRVDRRLGLAAFVGGFLAMIASGSRGAWVGATLGLGAAIFVGHRRGWLGSRAIAILASVAVISGLTVRSVITARLEQLGGAAALSRLPLMDLAREMIADHLVLGVGANNFATALPPYLTHDFNVAWISTVHNKYLLVWAETGLIGLVAFLGMIGYTLWLGLRVSRRPDAFSATIAIGLLAGIGAQLVHMFVDVFHNRPLTLALWTVMGFIGALAGQTEERSDHPSVATRGGPPSKDPESDPVRIRRPGRRRDA